MILDQLPAPSNFVLLGFNAGLLFMQVLLFCTSLFLMLLILVQRGKGGGLTGALGGMGGQSAFGAKAGDAFTKITVVTAIIWITLCMITIAAFNPPPRTAQKPPEETSQQSDATLNAGPDDSGEQSPSDSDSPDTAGQPAGGQAESGEAESPESEDAESGFQLELDGPDNGQSKSSGTNENDGGNAEENTPEDKSPSTAAEADGK